MLIFALINAFFYTSVVVDLFRGDTAIKAKLEEVKHFNVNVSITAPSLAELFKGAYLASRHEEAALLVRDFAKSISLLELSKKSCELFGKTPVIRREPLMANGVFLHRKSIGGVVFWNECQSIHELSETKVWEESE